jgi:hypothetical protein
VPPALRARVALVALLGIFLIPVLATSLRGVTHVTTCAREAEIPFTIIIPPDGRADIISAAMLDRNQEGDDGDVCGGLRLRSAVGPAGAGMVKVELSIVNDTDFHWKGSAKLRLAGADIPVSIGRIAPGATESDTVDLRVPSGTHELRGTLLIGP